MVGLIGLMVIAMGVSADEDGFEAPDSPDSRDDDPQLLRADADAGNAMAAPGNGSRHQATDYPRGCGWGSSYEPSHAAKEAVKMAFDLYCDGCGRRDEVWRRVVNAGKKPKGIVTGGYTMPIGTFDCVKYGGKYTIIFY